MLAKIERLRGGVSIQLANGPVEITTDDPTTIGELVLELLARPQPEQVTAEADETTHDARSGAPPPTSAQWTPKGETLEEMAAELEEMARANVGKAARSGLGWLRGISTHGKG